MQVCLRSSQYGVEAGHWQRGTHCSVQIGDLLSHVLVQAEAHDMNVRPPVQLSA
jgi:hypothetical protein